VLDIQLAYGGMHFVTNDSPSGLLVPINVWLFTNGQTYIQFNSNIHGYQYNILLHNQNLACRHFEPLFLHNTVHSVASINRMIGPFIFPYQFSHGQFDILSIEQILFEQGFMIYR